MDSHKAEEGDPLEDLLRSCSSITDKALSCRTFTSQKTGFGADDSVQALIREEQAIARWLDRQTLEHRSRVHHQATRTTLSRSALQRRLLDESVQMQQEHTLLSRMLQSRVAIQTSFASEPTDSTYLRQQALQSRNAQVAVALPLSRTLDDLRRNVRQVSEECRKLQRDNRDVLKSIEHVEEDASHGTKSIVPAETKRLCDESLVLKRALADLLSGSKLDWYTDKRLSEIMLLLDE
jgi:hypothetical protein